MIKFFRKIRQQLLSENKFSKYLIYAIGEIILVVIGILIALQINNWNENRQQALKTEKLIERLLSETEININNVKSEIENSERSRKNIISLLNLFGKESYDNEEEKIDSLIQFIAPDYTFALTLTAFLEAKDNGEISYIENDTLRTSLYHLAAFSESLKERQAISNNDNIHFLMPFIYKNTNRRNIHAKNIDITRNAIGASKLEKNNYSMLLNNREFENLMNARFVYAEGMASYYNYTELFLEYLKKLLIEASNNADE